MGTFSKRIRDVISALSVADQTFAKAGGITRQTLSGYLNTDREPGRDTLAAWVQAYDIDAHWLLTGEGKMFRKEGPMTIRRLRPNAQAESACVVEEGEDAPVGQVVPVHAMAAGGLALERWEPEPICKICIPVTYYKDSVLIVQIKGRSMEPEIRDGAFVGLDTSQTEIIAGERYGVRVPYEGLTVKRVFIDPQAGELILRSIDPEHPQMRVAVDGRVDLIVGRAVWVMQML